jgi:SAM-dependent methyltransferase
VNLIRRAILSLQEKGIRKTAAAVFRILATHLSRLGDYYFDLRYGTDTRRIIELDKLDIKSQNKPRGVRYEPTRARPFKRVMKRLDFPQQSVLVDFGCGKGRILMIAAQFGFKKVVGVDFSPQLCQMAKHNLEIYKRKTKLDPEVKIVESDAVDYTINPDENVFFFFNPFDGLVMKKVLENIVDSQKIEKRKIWLIYYNPVCNQVIESQGIFKKTADYLFGGCRFYVYLSENYDTLKQQSC